MGLQLQAAVTLPLEGYCKPGRYFPIVVTGIDAAHTMVFSADGCLAGQMAVPANGQAVVPMLAISSPHELHWADGSLALHPPGDDERLIAGVTDHLTEAADFFPGKKLLPITLNSSDLLPGPPAAWETLDAIVLESPLFQRISDSQRSALLAGGVMLISIGNHPPDQIWPWRKAGLRWVLSCPVAGPKDEVINENIYAPTYGWAPGRSPAIRGQVVGVAVLLVLLTIALMLRPNRWTKSAAVGLSLLVAIGVIVWRHSLGFVDRAGGDILVAGDGLLQRDAFVYERAKEDSTLVVPWSGWTHPLFASVIGMNASSMKLNVSSNGQLTFIYDATVGHVQAFVRREISPGDLPSAASSSFSPMQQAAKLEYLDDGAQIVGEMEGSQARWPAVLIRRDQMSVRDKRK